MPSYDYKCKNENCNHTFETVQGMTEDKLVTCPECGQDTLKRLIGGGAHIVFKGSGFHCNDYSKGYHVTKGIDSSGSGKTGNKRIEQRTRTEALHKTPDGKRK